MPRSATQKGPPASYATQLAEAAHRDAWDPATLPWDQPRRTAEHPLPDSVSMLVGLPSARRMTRVQRERLKHSEVASHLSALAEGERRATLLAAETVLLCPHEYDEHRWFLGTLLADEAKHYVTLRRFTVEQLGYAPTPHRPVVQVFDELSREKDLGLNLLVGQVVLEGAAASLLAALLVAARDDLMRELLRRITRDEARHMKFSQGMATLRRGEVGRARRRRMEEVLLEAAWAGVASLVAERTWREFHLSAPEAREYTLATLRRRGVMAYFGKVVVRQLAARGFPVSTLERTIENHLEQRLRERS